MFAGLLIYILALALFASTQLCLYLCGYATERWKANHLLFMFLAFVYGCSVITLVVLASHE